MLGSELGLDKCLKLTIDCNVLKWYAGDDWEILNLYNLIFISYVLRRISIKYGV